MVHRVPSCFTAMVCLMPVATVLTPARTFLNVLLSVLVPSPSWPAAFLPMVHRVPSCCKATAYSAPAAQTFGMEPRAVVVVVVVVVVGVVGVGVGVGVVLSDLLIEMAFGVSSVLSQVVLKCMQNFVSKKLMLLHFDSCSHEARHCDKLARKLDEQLRYTSPAFVSHSFPWRTTHCVLDPGLLA